MGADGELGAAGQEREEVSERASKGERPELEPDCLSCGQQEAMPGSQARE